MSKVTEDLHRRVVVLEAALARLIYERTDETLALASAALHAGHELASPEADETRREFEEWYREYPRKKQPGYALKSYRKARKAGASAAQLLTALRNYRWTATDPKYLPYPSSWLNGEAWRENPADEPVKPSQPDIWENAAHNLLHTPADFFGATIDGEVNYGD